MSVLEIKIPSPGESITEVQIARWLKKTGDFVEKDEEIAEIDSDKATLTVNADEAGEITILAAEGDTVAVGSVLATIDTSKKPSVVAPPKETPAVVVETPKAIEKVETANYATGHPSVAAQKILSENNIPTTVVNGTGKDGRITKEDAVQAVAKGFGAAPSTPILNTRDVQRVKLSMLRKKLSERLVNVKNTTAMLTTFNEVDMSAIMALRTQYKDIFKEKHGVGLGFMSFFTKAVSIALLKYPSVNGKIEGEELVTHNYCDIGIAVSAPKGLMVPVLRNAENMSLAQIEATIGALAKKARDGKLSMDDMEGGTFTITNGGVFGSMLSTPIINPPQSAILGMHNIVERPVAINGKVEIRPIMYVALSYDHRIIDGKESVGFLVTVKQLLENPIKMLYSGVEPATILLQL